MAAEVRKAKIVRVPVSMIARIDEARGSVAFEVWARAAFEAALAEHERSSSVMGRLFARTAERP